MRKSASYRFLFPFVTLLAFMSQGALAQDTPDRWEIQEENWYVLEMADAKIGWMHSLVSSDGLHYRSETTTEMSIARGAVSLKIRTETFFLETIEGKPLTMRSVQDMSLSKIKQEWIFRDEKVIHVSYQGGQKVTKIVEWPDESWLTPHAIASYIREMIEEGAMEINYTMLSPEFGIKPLHITMTYSGDVLYETETQSWPVTVWKTSNDILDIPTREMYTAEGLSVFMEMEAPFGKIVTRLATESEAKAKPKEGGIPELMLSTFIKPDRAIENPLKATTARLLLKAKNGKLPEIPAAGAQRVEVDPETGEVLLMIDIYANQDATPEEIDDDAYRTASGLINPDDKLIAGLARRAVRRSSEDPMARAEALRKFVNRHISRKSLSTAFASASETARSKTGDCTEHGVLLAAMLRADGIPARVASGLVYAESFAGEDDIFGWHMWTQALIDGKWVDFDATLPVRYSAAHILTGTSSLSQGSASADLSSLLMLLGNLEIEVVEVGYGEEGKRE